MTGLDHLFAKKKPCPTQRDDELLDLIYKRSTGSNYFDEVQMLIEAFRGFNKVLTIDMKKSANAINIFVGNAGLLALSGISFKISPQASSYK